MNGVRVISGEIRKLRDRIGKVEEALRHIEEISRLETELNKGGKAENSLS